jgi:ATP:ADP antiporter, AAA family
VFCKFCKLILTLFLLDFISYTSNYFQIPFKQLPRILFHACLLSLIIAGFWLLDSLKDPVLVRIVGIEYQPVAKLLSVITTLIVTCTYDFLTSKVSKGNLFHLVSAVFGTIFMIISALLANPETGIRNSDGANPYRLLGWAAYLSIESYGSLMVALFWSFTNSIMNLEEAKGAYGLIISVAQFGAIIGSTLATNSKSIGISVLFLVGAMSIFVISLVVKVYHICYPKTAQLLTPVHDTYDDHQIDYSFQSFADGMFLVIRSRYMLLLLGISCSYEIVVTVMDYQFKLLAAAASTVKGTQNISTADPSHVYGDVYEDQFANLLGHFGQATNLFSFLVSFFGFSFLVHRFGVRNSLMIFPTILFTTVIISNLVPNLSVLFISVSVIKALIFSLHDPVKELLYIPTSLSVKFKAKAWIDVFGSRVAKALGAVVTYLSYGNASTLRTISEVPCLIISFGVIVLAYTVGNEFDNKVANRED